MIWHSLGKTYPLYCWFCAGRIICFENARLLQFSPTLRLKGGLSKQCDTDDCSFPVYMKQDSCENISEESDAIWNKDTFLLNSRNLKKVSLTVAAYRPPHTSGHKVHLKTQGASLTYLFVCLLIIKILQIAYRF